MTDLETKQQQAIAIASAKMRLAGKGEQPQRGMPSWLAGPTASLERGVPFSDEAAGAGRAAGAYINAFIDALRSGSLPTIDSLRDAGAEAYDRGKGDALETARAFRARNPVTGFGLETLGGFGSFGAGKTPAASTIRELGNQTAKSGALFGTIYGLGEGEGILGRISGAAQQGLMGAVTGKVLGTVAGKFAERAARRSAIPTTEQLAKKGDALYKAADAEGLVIDSKSFGKFAQDVAAYLKTKGLNEKITPKAAAALDEIVNSQGDLSLRSIDQLRQIARRAAQSNEPAEQYFAGKIIEKIDDYLVNLTPNDVVARNIGKATDILREARDIWSRFRKSQIIGRAIQMAEQKSNTYTQSGIENSIIREFGKLRNKIIQGHKSVRGFTEAEKKAIFHVANGGKLPNLLRQLGRWAIKGPVSGLGAFGAGGLAHMASGGDPLISIGTTAATGALGGTARSAATAMAKARMNALDQLVRSGGNLPAANITPLLQHGVQAGTLFGAEQVARMPLLMQGPQ